jgi:hypothetical protein
MALDEERKPSIEKEEKVRAEARAQAAEGQEREAAIPEQGEERGEPLQVASWADWLRERFEKGADNFGGWKLTPDARTQRI